MIYVGTRETDMRWGVNMYFFSTGTQIDMAAYEEDRSSKKKQSDTLLVFAADRSIKGKRCNHGAPV